MQTPEFITADDGHRIAYYRWEAAQPVKGVVHWLHGMSEHGARHQLLAARLNAAGWHLLCHDHRGHGLSADDAAPLGLFAASNGWQKTQDDVACIQQRIQEVYPNLPVVLAGHSMGSFIARDYAEHANSGAFAGVIFCGSDYQPPLFYRMMRLLLRVVSLKKSDHALSQFIKSLTFDAWNKTLRPNRTEFDWLSTDEAAVDAYISDPLCGHDASPSLWRDLLGALQRIESKKQLAGIPDGLPVLLIGGNQDPMSRCGKGMAALKRAIEKHSKAKVTAQQFEGRHEILHDTCQEEVMRSIVGWLNQLG